MVHKCFCCKEEINDHSQACDHCARTCLIIRYDNPHYTCVPECSDCETTNGNILPSVAKIGTFYCDSCWKDRHEKSTS